MARSSHTYTHISIIERTKIEVFIDQGMGVSAIARVLNRAKSSISCEIKRGRYNGKYTARIAQARSHKAKQLPRKLKAAQNQSLMHKIERLLRKRWSPEIIAHYLEEKISHTTIYTIIKTIRPQWRKYLAYQKKSKYHKGYGRKYLIPYRTDIGLRPNEKSFGDYEADTLISAQPGKAALAVFVERKTRLYRIIKMPDKIAHSIFKATFQALKGSPVNSITYDNGSENSEHFVINRLLGCASYFARPYRSTDKGLIENRNKILRQFLPKKTNFDLITNEQINKIENQINERPMKCLKWKSPKQAFIQKTFGLNL